jgi:hypothetical protein
MVIDGDGRPECLEMWPGNTADVTTLIPVIDRLRRRFAIARVCVIADRGLISAETLAELEGARLLYTSACASAKVGARARARRSRTVRAADAGGYDTVRRYARLWTKEHGAATAAVYVPLSFAPGEAYQFDWSHEVVLLSGATVTVKVAHVRLCHSRMLFVRAYPRETQDRAIPMSDWVERIPFARRAITSSVSWRICRSTARASALARQRSSPTCIAPPPSFAC